MAGAGVGSVTGTTVSGEIPRSPARVVDPNEQVLRIMHSLGIDPAKTKEVFIIRLMLVCREQCLIGMCFILEFALKQL